MKRAIMLLVLVSTCGVLGYFVMKTALESHPAGVSQTNMDNMRAKLTSVEVTSIEPDTFEAYLSVLIKRGLMSENDRDSYRKTRASLRLLRISLEFTNNTGVDVTNAVRLGPGSPIKSFMKFDLTGGKVKFFDRRLQVRIIVDPSGLSEADLRGMISKTEAVAYWVKGFCPLDEEIGFGEPPDDTFLKEKGIFSRNIKIGDAQITIRDK